MEFPLFSHGLVGIDDVAVIILESVKKIFAGIFIVLVFILVFIFVLVFIVVIVLVFILVFVVFCLCFSPSSVFGRFNGQKPAEDGIVDDGVDEPDEKLEQKNAYEENDVGKHRIDECD